MSQTYNLNKSVYVSTPDDLDAKYRMVDLDAQKALISGDLVQLGHVIYREDLGERYELTLYPDHLDPETAEWTKIGGNATLQEVTDKGATTNNSIKIEKAVAPFAGPPVDFLVTTLESQVGTTVANWIEVNREAGNPTDGMFGQLVRVNYKAAGPVEDVVAANFISRNSGDGDVTGIMNAARYQSEALGSGDVSSMRGFEAQSMNKGTGNVDFISGIQTYAWNTGTGVTDYMRGLDTNVKIENSLLSVNWFQGQHTTLNFVEGTINNGGQVTFLDIDVDTANLGGTLNINGDVAFLQGGGGSDVEALKNHLNTNGNKLRFIWNQGTAESDFSGVVNVLNPVEDIEAATEKVLDRKSVV